MILCAPDRPEICLLFQYSGNCDELPVRMRMSSACRIYDCGLNCVFTFVESADVGRLEHSQLLYDRGRQQPIYGTIDGCYEVNFDSLFHFRLHELTDGAFRTLSVKTFSRTS